MMTVLQRQGATVTACVTIAETLYWLDQGTPECIVCAVNPTSTHRVLAFMQDWRQFEARQGWLLLPVIIVFDSVRDVSSSKTLKAGFQAALAKPLVWNQFIQTIGHARLEIEVN